MDTIYEHLLRPRLFKQDPEEAHQRGIKALRRLGSLGPITRAFASYNQTKAQHPVNAFGLSFPNVVGVAAGMDKDAECVNGLAALGFGHVEVGTVTPVAQEGNPKPRLFRFPEQDAVINRMGFNNAGAVALASRLASEAPIKRRKFIIGVNIGKNKNTPLEHAAEDYARCVQELWEQANYFTVNVSSPNTPHLRSLQDRKPLERILRAVQIANREKAAEHNTSGRPVLLKIAPDLTFAQIDEVLEVIEATHLAGIVATNTTIARPGSLSVANEVGGLSGQPLRHPSTSVIRYIAKASSGRLPIIGVGGVDDPLSAGEKMDAGATLVQIYTGLVYRGPMVGRSVARAFRTQQTDWV